MGHTKYLFVFAMANALLLGIMLAVFILPARHNTQQTNQQIALQNRHYAALVSRDYQALSQEFEAMAAHLPLITQSQVMYILEDIRHLASQDGLHKTSFAIGEPIALDIPTGDTIKEIQILLENSGTEAAILNFLYALEKAPGIIANVQFIWEDYDNVRLRLAMSIFAV